jgi:hypothetical protein
MSKSDERDRMPVFPLVIGQDEHRARPGHILET